MVSEVTAGGYTPDCYAEFQRAVATTTYAADEFVGLDDVAAANNGPLKFSACREPNGSGLITGATLVKSTNVIATAGFRLWLFIRQPFAAGAYPLDNAALVNQFSYTALKSLIGHIDFQQSDFIAHSASASCEGFAYRPALPFSLRHVKASIDTDFVDIAGVGRARGDRLIYGVLSTLGAYVPGASETFKINLDVQQD